MKSPTLTENFILLHATKYGESSLILHGYSCRNGRTSFLLKGVGKKKSTSFLHPLSIIEAELIPSRKIGGGSYTGSTGIVGIKNLTPKHKLSSIRTSLIKGSISTFICELLYKLLTHHEDGVHTYEFLENSILLLEEMEGSVSNFHLWFITMLSSVLGIMPSSMHSADNHPFSESEIKIIDYIMNQGFENFMTLSLRGSQRSNFLDSAIKYIETHLSINLNIKSLKVLHQIYL